MKNKAFITGAFVNLKMDGSTTGWVGGYAYSLLGQGIVGGKIKSDDDEIAVSLKSVDAKGSGEKPKLRVMIS